MCEKANMAGYCTIVLYFRSPVAHENTAAHVQYPAILPSHPSNNNYIYYRGIIKWHFHYHSLSVQLSCVAFEQLYSLSGYKTALRLLLGLR